MASRPKGWPRRVRSALLYAVPLAQVPLTATRNLAENSYNARLRFKAGNDRLQSGRLSPDGRVH